jgi:hypothetical protein
MVGDVMTMIIASAPHCSTLLHTAPHCSTLLHTLHTPGGGTVREWGGLGAYDDAG